MLFRTVLRHGSRLLPPANGPSGASEPHFYVFKALLQLFRRDLMRLDVVYMEYEMLDCNGLGCAVSQLNIKMTKANNCEIFNEVSQ